MYFPCGILLLIHLIQRFGLVRSCSSSSWALWSFLYSDRNWPFPLCFSFVATFIPCKLNPIIMKSPGGKVYFYQRSSVTHPPPPPLEIKMCILSSNFLWHAELWNCICFIKGLRLNRSDLLGGCSEKLFAGLISFWALAILKQKDAHKQPFILI